MIAFHFLFADLAIEEASLSSLFSADTAQLRRGDSARISFHDEA